MSEPDPTRVLTLLKHRIAWGRHCDDNHLLTYYNFEELINEAEDRARSEE